MSFKPRILLVDDDTTALELMGEVLSEKDYEVDTSSRVDLAVEKLRTPENARENGNGSSPIHR